MIFLAIYRPLSASKVENAFFQFNNTLSVFQRILYRIFWNLWRAVHVNSTSLQTSPFSIWSIISWVPSSLWDTVLNVLQFFCFHNSDGFEKSKKILILKIIRINRIFDWAALPHKYFWRLQICVWSKRYSVVWNKYLFGCPQSNMLFISWGRDKWVSGRNEVTKLAKSRSKKNVIYSDAFFRFKVWNNSDDHYNSLKFSSNLLNRSSGNSGEHEILNQMFNHSLFRNQK